jgi:hypothetical protein
MISQTDSPLEEEVMLTSLFGWLPSAAPRNRAGRSGRQQLPRPRAVRRRSYVPRLDFLEDRTVLSVLTVLNNADSGAGSLRAAIAAAQSGDTIVFDPSMAYQTITLSSVPLAISSNVTINGLGANLLTISGNNANQLFTLSGSAQVTLANLTLTGGKSSQGGAIFLGGTAALTLDSDVLSGNQAVGDANNNALGGAVYNSAGASLTIDNSSFVNNQTNATNNSFGGAIANAGTLAINGATFTGNAALGSTALIGNPQPGGSQGGAIGNLDGSTATITLSTFSGNQALGTGTGDAEGGAICNEDAYVVPFTGSGVTLSVSQCTFANNSAKGGSNAGNPVTNPSPGEGGAIEDLPGTNLAVLNCSFTGNQANSGGGVGANGGAIDNEPAITATISDSQFISDSAIGSAPGATVFGGAVFNSSTTTISGCQFISNSANASSGVGASGVGGAVENNQGTMIIANCLFTGNSVVGGPMSANGVNIGQARGGAIETQQPGAVLTVSNSTVAGNEAIAGSGGAASTDLAAGGGISNGFGGRLNVASCTITGNHAIGGATASGSGGTAFGGGILNYQGTLNLKDSTVSANLCQGGAGPSGAAGGIAYGGGIENRNSTAILTNCTVSLNECLGGAGGAGANGGLAGGGGISNRNSSSLTLSNCALFGNVAQGGVEGSGAVGGDALGGGLWAQSGTVVLQGVLVTGNQAQGGGDGQGNTTGQGLGGGVYVDPSAAVTADLETFMAGNQASKSNNDVWGTIAYPP